jgi:alpha-ribazole phosphatase
MEIYLIRHTRVDVPPGICYGRSDVPLAKSFEEEAFRIRDNLADIPIDTVYCSPLERCTRLARYLFGKQYRTDDRLMELNFGEWEMKAWEDIYKHPLGPAWMNNYLNAPCPGGESLPMLVERIKDFLDELSRQPVECCAIVTHAGVIRACRHLIEGDTLEECFAREVVHGSISTISLA